MPRQRPAARLACAPWLLVLTALPFLGPRTPRPNPPRRTAAPPTRLAATFREVPAGNRSNGTAAIQEALRAVGVEPLFEVYEGGSEEATCAWINEKLRTMTGEAIALPLFLTDTDNRTGMALKVLEEVRSTMEEPPDSEAMEGLLHDALFLGTHACAAEAGAWFGSEAWPAAILERAALPALTEAEAARVLLRRLPGVARDEVEEVIGAFVAASWGEHHAVNTSVAAPPQFAAVQYAVGVLWGYALRGLVVRLALERSMGASQGRLLQYANKFFKHDEWVALCRPSDTALEVLEGELDEALPGIALLAGVDDSELMLPMLGEDEDEDEEELVVLPQKEWGGSLRRATAFGAALADAEASMDSRKLAWDGNKAQRWLSFVRESKALTAVRSEQGEAIIGGLLSPVQRLATALRRHVLASKLRGARKGLERIYGRDASP